MRAAKTLLLGYVGKHNFGDDMMVEAVERFAGADSCEVISGRMPLPRIIPKLIRAKRIVVCGGHVINERTGSYQRLMVLAKIFGVQRVFFSIEASGWPKGRAGKLQRWIMSGAQISIRTPESRAIIAKHVPSAQITDVIDVFYFHPALTKDSPSGSKKVARFEFSAHPTDSGQIFVLPRSFSEGASYSESANIARIASAVQQLDTPKGQREVIVSPSAAVDDPAAVAKALESAGHRVSQLGIEAPLYLHPSAHVVTNRLHIAKVCAFFDVPMILVSYDRKTECPELIGSVGEILQLSGAELDVKDIAVPEEIFFMRKRMSAAVLKDQVAS